jgi:hypothetical protein
MADIFDCSSEAINCRDRAAACRRKAETAGPGYRSCFLGMAESWELLADHYARLVLIGVVSLPKISEAGPRH